MSDLTPRELRHKLRHRTAIDDEITVDGLLIIRTDAYRIEVYRDLIFRVAGFQTRMDWGATVEKFMTWWTWWQAREDVPAPAPPRRKSVKSPYYGVTLTPYNRWHARVSDSGKRQVYLGSFPTADAAALAVNAYIVARGLNKQLNNVAGAA